MVLKRAIFTSLLALLLAACVKSDPLYDFPGSSSFPTVTASSTNASPGDFVEVTVKVLVSLDERSSYEERTTDFDFGVCFFMPEDMLNCSPGTSFVLPEGIMIKEGESHVIPVKQTVKRGQYVTIEHTFNFTSSIPQEVTLVGQTEGPSENNASLPKDYVLVTFE